METGDVNYDKMIESLMTALNKTEEDECPIVFTSRKDESSFFPSDIDGWELVLRSSRFIPAHYVNDGKYQRVGTGVTNEEAQPSGI
jgi:hypothetical protein